VVSTRSLFSVTLHIWERFRIVYQVVPDRRFEDNAEGVNVTADALKIAVYSVFRKLISGFFWLLISGLPSP